MARDDALQLVEVELSNGAVAIERARPLPYASRFVRSEYDFERRELRLELDTGEQVVAEIGSGHDDMRGRPIVYLDQCHWVNLARHLYVPHKVPAAEQDACERLVMLARIGTVILPLSAAHLTETAPDGRWRQHLALTMLELSRGWQMRSPLIVRDRELSAAFCRKLGRPLGKLENGWPFTLEPRALFAEPKPESRSKATDLPAPWLDLVDRLSGVSAVFEAMLEDESPDNPGRPLAERWAAGHQRLTDYMRDVQMGQQHSRINATIALLADLEAEMATAAAAVGMPEDELSSWAEESIEGIGALPYLGRLRDVIYHRLRGAGRPWEASHLNDLMFLACAAGYADVLVGENETTHLLQRGVRDRPTGAGTYSTLRAAIDAIESLALGSGMSLPGTRHADG